VIWLRRQRSRRRLLLIGQFTLGRRGAQVTIATESENYGSGPVIGPGPAAFPATL